MYQRYRSSKTDMLKPVRWVSAQTPVFFFHILLSFLLSFSYRLGGLRRLPSSGLMNMYMYKLAIDFSLLLSFSGPAMHWQC